MKRTSKYCTIFPGTYCFFTRYHSQCSLCKGTEQALNYNYKLLGGLVGLVVCFNVCCSISSANLPAPTPNHSKPWLAQNFELPGDLDISEDEPSSAEKSPISLPKSTSSDESPSRSLPSTNTSNSTPTSTNQDQVVTLPALDHDHPVVTDSPSDSQSPTWQSIPAAKIDSPEDKEEISPNSNTFPEDEDLDILYAI